MKPWLIIPAKPFDEAKSRLASVLSAPQRAALSANLFERTLRTAVTADCFTQILVVSRDPVVLALATRFGALPLLEADADLNAAVTQACDQATALGGKAALILPTDLPRVRTSDLHALVAAFGDGGRIVITPSSDGGTNALLLPLPAPFAFAFGPDSFCAHRIRATEAGYDLQAILTATLRFDLDSPRDWEELTATAPFSVIAQLADSHL
jgi:2-phospho-L-lactate guanylyltransferase